MTPRILYVIGQLDKGGAEQQLYYLLKSLRPTGKIISLTAGGYWGIPIQELGYDVIELTRHSRFDLRRLLALILVIREYQPDIVHIFTDGPAGIYGRLAALFTAVPHVIVGERRHPSLDPMWYTRLKKHVLNRFITVVVCNAETAVSYMQAHQLVSKSKVRFIPNGLDFANVLKASPIERPPEWKDRLVIGMVCNLRPKKSPRDFIELAHRLIKNGNNVQFLHVGDGPLMPIIQDQCEKLAVTDRIQLSGRQNNVGDYLLVMDIFVLTSHNEGMSNAVMEAMAAQLPCVVTDTGDNAKLIQHGKNGFVFSVGDIEAMVRYTEQLIEDHSLRKRMGAAGYQLIQSYSISNMMDQYRQLYNQVSTHKKL